MSDTGEIDLQRVILQSLESWNAAGITHLTAAALAPLAAPEEGVPRSLPTAVMNTLAIDSRTPQPVTLQPTPADLSPSEASASQTETNEQMARKPAVSKPPEWFEMSEPATSATPKGPAVVKNLSREDRVAELKILSQKVAKCTRCTELASTRTQTVFGVGNPQARVVFVGEAPGADEDAQGEPFVGRAGQLLNKIIEVMKLTREEIYICNVLRCRPPGNRLPLPEEAGNCREYLDGQLGIINPEYIVCWGSCASQNLLGVTDSIGKLRGRFFQYGNARVLCTYHPSYLLRNPPAKKDVWDDMKILMKEMGIPIE